MLPAGGQFNRSFHHPSNQTTNSTDVSMLHAVTERHLVEQTHSVDYRIKISLIGARLQRRGLRLSSSPLSLGICMRHRQLRIARTTRTLPARDSQHRSGRKTSATEHDRRTGRAGGPRTSRVAMTRSTAIARAARSTIPRATASDGFSRTAPCMRLPPEPAALKRESPKRERPKRESPKWDRKREPHPSPEQLSRRRRGR